MGKFNEYAQRVNEIAKSYFTEYAESSAKFKEADTKCKEAPLKLGAGAEYEAKAMRAIADYKIAKENYSKVKSKVAEEKQKELATLRSELVKAVNNAYAADPAKMDMATIELMKSGILKANEYAKLMQEAEAAGNTTMMRIIGNEANKLAGGDVSKEDALLYRSISFKGRESDGSEYLQAYDYMSDVFNRCIKNPALCDKWDELTANILENM